MIVLLVIVGLLFFIQLGKILYYFILNKVREYKLNEGRILLSSIGKNVAKEDIDRLFGFKGKWVGDLYAPYKGVSNYYDTYSSYIWKEKGLIYSFVFCNNKVYSKNVSMKGN